jgi:hypothetical protein
MYLIGTEQDYVRDIGLSSFVASQAEIGIWEWVVHYMEALCAIIQQFCS